VLALALAVVAQSAPITGQQEQLLDNIQNAADDQAAQDEDKAEATNAAAKKVELQLESNQNFAQSMSQQVADDASVLEKMKADEKQSIKDARKIDSDAQAATSDNMENEEEDMERLDADAENMSDEIQRDAEKLDKKLLDAKAKMKSVGISEELGESQDPENDDPSTAQDGNFNQDDYSDQLSQAESDAEDTVAQAQQDRQAAEDRKMAAEDKMSDLKQQASQGLKQLKKAEARLAMDLNGHTDTQLEHDIENKVADMEQAVERNEELGESPLEAAERQAEQASDDSDQSFDDSSSDPAIDDQADDNYEAPRMAAQDQQAMNQGEVSADLSAIESDAKQLEAYQKSSISEIEKIAKPLQ